MSASATFTAQPNLMEAVPFLRVTRMVEALRFYVDGLGFAIVLDWRPEGSIRWCRLERDGVALMLQDYLSGQAPATALGLGVSISFTCGDALALYHEFLSRGLAPRRPFVGNGMWVVAITDPDGYQLEFQSVTDAPEESEYQG